MSDLSYNNIYDYLDSSYKYKKNFYEYIIKNNLQFEYFDDEDPEEWLTYGLDEEYSKFLSLYEKQLLEDEIKVNQTTTKKVSKI